MDVDVTWDDQNNINAFGRLSQKLHDLRDDLVQKQVPNQALLSLLLSPYRGNVPPSCFFVLFQSIPSHSSWFFLNQLFISFRMRSTKSKTQTGNYYSPTMKVPLSK